MDDARQFGELVGLTGRYQGSRYPLDRPLIRVGRDAACEIRLLGDAIAEVHAVLVCGGEQVVVSSWSGAEVSLDGDRIEQECPRDRAILRFGPHAFQLRLAHTPQAILTLPGQGQLLREAEPDPDPAAEFTAESLEARRLQLESLQRQLRESRAGLRAERERQEAEIRQQFQDLAEAFDETDRREARAEQERERLLKLRARMIGRWRRHWTHQRSRIEQQTRALQDDLADLVRQRATFVEHRDQFEQWARRERLDLADARQALEVDRAVWELERQQQREQLQTDQHALTQQRREQERRDRAQKGEQERLARKVRRLREEEAGLQARVANLRRQLDALPAAPRPVAPAALGGDEEPTILRLSRELPANAIYVRSPLKPEAKLQEERRQALDRLAQTLADQQAVLSEQFDRIVVAKEFWRAEERRVVDELEQLTHALHAQDARQQEQDRDLQARERELLAQQQSVREQLQQLEAGRQKLLLQENQFRVERDRKRAEIVQAERQAERVQATYETLCHRWLTSRAQEQAQRQEAAQRLEGVYERWQGECEQVAALRARLEDRERAVGQRELTLELTRQSMLESAPDRRLLEKRLERYRRHVLGSFRHAEARLQQQRDGVRQDREALRELLQQASQRLQLVERQEDRLRERLTHLEQGETTMKLERQQHESLQSMWVGQKQQYEEELHQLRAELGRLLGPSRPPAAERQAA